MYCYLSVTSVTELILKHLNCNAPVTSVTDVTEGSFNQHTKVLLPNSGNSKNTFVKEFMKSFILKLKMECMVIKVVKLWRRTTCPSLKHLPKIHPEKQK